MPACQFDRSGLAEPGDDDVFADADVQVGDSGAMEDPDAAAAADAALPPPPADATVPPPPGDAARPDASMDTPPTGLVTAGPPSVVGDLGGNGGSAFSADCPGGRVVVGFDAEDNSFGLCHVKALCRSLLLDDDGNVSLVDEVATAEFGNESSVVNIAAVRCPTGSVVVGFSGSESSQSLVHHIRLRCADVSWDGQAASLGPSFDGGLNLGSPSNFAVGTGNCAPGMVAGGFQGRAGTILDRFQLRCYALAPVFP